MRYLLPTVCLCLKFPVAIYYLFGVVNYMFYVFAAAPMEAVLFTIARPSSLEFTARRFAKSSSVD